MSPTVAALAAVIGVYFILHLYRIVRNVINAHRAGLPYVVIPWDQNAFVWMVLSVPLRPVLQRTLPKFLWDRAAITIYGWEFHEGFAPFERWAGRGGGGNGRTLAYVTSGKFEINTWDPELAVEILRRPRDFQEPSFNELFMGRFGHNVFTSNGEQWARQRKIIAQVINERISRLVFDETVHQTTGLLDDVLGPGAGSNGDGAAAATAETYGLFDMMKRITIHVLSGAGMGQSVPWRSDAAEKPRQGYRTTYMEACKTVIEGVAGPIILPQWFLDHYPTFMPGHAYIKALSHAVREFPLHTRDMLDMERKRLAQHGAGAGESRSNMVSQLIHAADGGKAGGKGLSEDEMVGNLFIFTAAGFDTTANTLSYALAVLARFPRWQEWMFEEIDRIMPAAEEESGTLVDYATVFPKATRVLAVMLETLRLFPPVIHLPKSAHGTQTIRTSTGTHVIPHGTTCYVDSIGLHLDPAVWRDLNPDAEEKQSTASGEDHSTTSEDNQSTASPAEPDETIFRPSRWINPPGSAQPLFQAPKGSYVPWSMGPRNCPGMKMAQVEFTATLLTLFRRHRIEAVALQVPDRAGAPGLGTRAETPAEVARRLGERIRDSTSILTLQMNGVYDVAGTAAEQKGIKLRVARRG